MPGVVATRPTFAADGVTVNGFGVTPSGGGAEFIFNISNSPGAIPSAIESAIRTLAATQLPTLSVFAHCFSIVPFHVTLFICDPGGAPPNALWWVGP